MEAKFFDSLSGGDSAAGLKLCMGLTEGDFWVRPAGAWLLYKGQDANDIDFDRIIAASNINDDFKISSGGPLSCFIYVVRCVNCCGIEEKTLSASVTVEFDALGNLIKRACNKVFMVTATRCAGGRISLKWFYQPIHQAKKISKFRIYGDSGTGQIDYQTAIGSVNYIGRKFYQFVTNELAGDNYKFCIRAVAADSCDDGFTGQIVVQPGKQSPEGVSILICQTE
jgi:hypothetical protein